MDDQQLKKLKEVIPARWRVQRFSENKPQALCIAYIDARDAMDLLDKAVGPENWQDKYEEVRGQLFAGVGIKIKDEWVWKWDTGTAALTEGEKSIVSDSFKRACVKWGIGRFLYDLDLVYLKANEIKRENPKNYPYPVDEQGNRIWDLTEHINNLKK